MGQGIGNGNMVGKLAATSANILVFNFFQIPETGEKTGAQQGK